MANLDNYSNKILLAQQCGFQKVWKILLLTLPFFSFPRFFLSSFLEFYVMWDTSINRQEVLRGESSLSKVKHLVLKKDQFDPPKILFEVKIYIFLTFMLINFLVQTLRSTVC